MSWLDGYRYRRKVTIDNTKIDGTLTDFPVALLINSSAGLGADDLTAIFGSGRVVKDAWRKRIAVTTSDGATECPVEIELWDTDNQKAVLHTKVPSISSSADTEIYLYYGATADNASVGDIGDAAAQNVWDANFVGVWHMAQDPSGGAGCMLDSTSNGNDGTPSGVTASGDLVDGLKGGKALDFDEVDDYVDCGSDSTLDDISLLTAEALFNADDFGEYGTGRLMSKALVNTGWSLILHDSYGGIDFIKTSSGGQGLWYGGTVIADGTTWHYAVATHDDTSINNDPELYLDGNSVTVTESTAPSGSWHSEAAENLRIGARNNSGTIDREFDGKVGEIRVSDINRSAAWVKATYNTLFDTLLTWSAEEEHAWLSGYKFRRKFTIDNTKIDGDLTDFPVTLQLNATAGTGTDDLTKIFTDTALDANRKKIAVTTADGETECYVEIERWSTADVEAVLHVKVPTILSGADTHIYLYWCGSADNDTYVGDTGDAVAQNVWDSDFKAVWHMSEDPTGGAGCILDSTSNGNDGTPSGTMTAGDSVDGQTGKALDFDGSDDLINCGSDASLDDMGTFTLEALAYPDTFGGGSAARILSKMNSSHSDGWDFYIHDNNDNLNFVQRMSGDSGIWTSPSSSVSTGSWQHLAATYDDSSVSNDAILYIDGASVSVTETQAPTGSVAADTANDLIIADLHPSDTDLRNFDGPICEVRVSGSIRSAAWIKATYHSLFDTLGSWGSEERYRWLTGGYSYRRKFTIDNTKIDAALPDFPVALHLTSSAGLGSTDLRRIFSENSDANRKKIAVTTDDGLTQCFVEIEDWDETNMQAALHVKVPSISSSADTELYLYFGGSADNTDWVGDTTDTPAQDVWDSYYVGVWHLAQDPSGGAGAVKDSTTNEQHMTSVGTMTSGDLVDFANGLKGIDFDGSDDGLYVDAAPLSGFPFTMESLLKNSLGNTSGLAGIVDASTPNEFAAVYAATNLATANAYRTANLQGSTSFGDGDVVHSALSLADDSNMVLYANGASEDTTPSSTPSWVSGYDRICIGSLYYSTPGYFIGIVGEFRMSSVARSAAWIKATYNTLNDTLVTWSEEEAFSGLGQYTYRRQILTDPSKVDADLADFPVALLIDATAGLGTEDLSGIFTANPDADRKKIAVTIANGLTQAYVEIELWDTANVAAVLHTKIAAVDDTWPTPIYLYYGGQADNTTYVGDTGDAVAQNVWDSDFVAVYHLSQDPSGGSGSILDSTSNENHATPNTIAAEALGDSLVGKGIHFDGSSDTITLPALFSEDFTQVTFEAAFASDVADTTAQRLVGYNEEGGHFRLQINNGTANLVEAIVYNGADKNDNDTIADVTADHFYAMTAEDNDVVQLFIDGAPTSSGVSIGGTFDQVSTPGRYLASSRGGASQYSDGVMAEARFSESIRSAAWIKATYNTLFDTLLTWGDQALAGTGEAEVNVDLGVIAVAFSAAALSIAIEVPFFANAIGINFTPASITIQEGTVMTSRHLQVTGRGLTPFAEGESLAPDVGGEGKPVNIGGE